MPDNPQQVENALSATETADFYDKRWASVGDKVTSHRRVRLDFILTCLHDFASADARILDIGCGSGWMAPHLSPYGTIVGVDFSPKAIEAANEKYTQYADFYVVDPPDPTFGIPNHNQFDVVIASEVIEHTLHQEDFVRQIRAHLKTNGLCILTTPNGNLWEEFKYKHARNLQPVENWLTPKMLKNLLQQNGFQLLWHYGGPHHSFYGDRFPWLQKPRVKKLFQLLRMSSLYGKLVLPSALYQLIAARKK